MKTDLKELLARMMDENDWEPVELTSDNGATERFNQVALLPVGVESAKYVDETVEHNFAVLQPLNDRDEEIGRSIIVDITINEDGEYALSLVENQILIHDIMAEYKNVRGITADDIADEKDVPDEDDDSVSDDCDGDADEADEAADPVDEEKTKKKGFFARLFGKNRD